MSWSNAISAYLITGTTNSKIMFTAVTPGTAGNSIRIKMLGGTTQTLATTVSSSDITIQLGTDGSGNVTSTVAQVIANVAASGPAAALVVATTGRVGPGDGLVAVLGSFTNLAGGSAQKAPTYADAFPAIDGWRSQTTSELLVTAAVAPTITSGVTAAVVSKAVVFSSSEQILVQTDQAQKAYHTGDVIKLLVQFDKAVKVVPSGATVPTVPITIGVNTRDLTYLQTLGTDKHQGTGSLLFGYTVVAADAGIAGGVQVGTGAVAANRTFGTSNAQIKFIAQTPGVAGNSITVVMTQSASQALSISVVGSAITIALHSSAGTGISLVSEVISFLLTDLSAGAVAARALVTATIGAGNGTGTVIAASVQNLTSGADSTTTFNLHSTANIVNFANGATQVTQTFTPPNTPTLTVN